MSVVGLGRFRNRRRLWGLASIALLLAACGGGGDDDRPGASVPDDESTTAPTPADETTSTTTASPAIDITTKPATVTVEYADAVMDELDRVLSDAIRDFVAADGPTKAFDDKLNAVYDEPSLENARQEYGKFAVDGTAEFKNPPGDVTTTVTEVLKSEPGCIVLKVARSFDGVFVSPNPDARRTSYIAWEPTDSDGSGNTTPWSVVFDGNVLEGEEPREAC